MAYENILVEGIERVGVIRLNRPKMLNALNTALMQEVGEALLGFDSDDAVGAIVITGNNRAFAAGADIKEMADATSADMLKTDFLGSWDTIRSIKKPVIAAVSGYALGGGCELAMMCDMIVASETALFGQPEINLGVIPGAGGTQRMLRAVGKALAMEIILNDRRLTAEEALAFRLINYIHPVEAYFDEAMALAQSIASRAPLAVQLAKESVNKGFEMTLAEGLAFEKRNFFYLFGTEDQKEGMDAFLNKREPEWKGQ